MASSIVSSIMVQPSSLDRRALADGDTLLFDVEDVTSIEIVQYSAKPVNAWGRRSL
jgi:hypothetical protein